MTSSSSAPPPPVSSPPSSGGTLRRRVEAFRERIRSKPGGRLGWRIGVTIVGVAVVAGGVVLLPLPGPGWLIIFAGLGVLSTEYAWAKRLLAFARAQVAGWTAWAKQRPRWIQLLLGLVGVVFLAAVLYAVYRVLY